jgi:hypothetical protein
MIAGDKVWIVFDVLPALPSNTPREATFVSAADGVTIVRGENNPQPVGVNDYDVVFDDEVEAWSYVAQRLRQHADHVLEAAEKAAANARRATVVRVGL